MSVAYVIDEIFTEHRSPTAHPERPERLLAVRDALQAARIDERGLRLPTRPATEEELARVHDAAYLEGLKRQLPGQTGWLDADTYYSPRTWDAVLAAAGAVVDVTRAVLAGERRRGMAFVRPPGHHAEAGRAMGFCILNNIAVGAAAARAQGAERVAIVDWDVHHGNGTQNIFYADPAVMYLSCHQFPYYPGTGAPDEVGTGAGAGTTVNVGLPAACGDREYSRVFDRLFVPVLREFKPDLIMVSAGFDSHVADTLAQMQVTRRGYQFMAARLCELADEMCDGRIVLSLEGGYHLEGLATSVAGVFEVFDRPPWDEPVTLDDFEGTPDDVDPVSAARVMAGALAAINRTQAALSASREG